MQQPPLVPGTGAQPGHRTMGAIPPPPPPRLPLLGGYLPYLLYDQDILAFDPTVLPYYEVFSIPEVTTSTLQPLNPKSEWLPSPFFLRVFSSRTGQWDERLFEREIHGLPTMGNVASIREHDEGLRDWLNCYSTLYRGRLHVQCQNGFVMRINTSSGTYHLIFKRPMGIDAARNAQYYLGKSKDGVYYAALEYKCRLQVWYLDESRSQLEWVLKCDTYLRSVLSPWSCYRAYGNNGPWFLRRYGDNNHIETVDEIGAPRLEWSSDMEDIPSEDGPGDKYANVKFLGFHPYKEVVFLHHSNIRGIAYHFNCSKIQDGV